MEDGYSTESPREWITKTETRIAAAGKAKFCWKLPREWRNLAQLWYSYTGAKWKRVNVLPLLVTGEPAITVTMANRTEEDLVIPTGDRFCWVTVGDERPEPLNFKEVNEVVDADDQVHEDVVEHVREDRGADSVGSTEVEDSTATGSEFQERLTDPGSEDKWQRFLSRTEEDCEEEELGQPSRWMIKEIMGEQPRNPMED